MKSIDILRDFKNFAVLGATIDEEKYGFKIVQRLCEIGKTVYPISPKYEEVNSLKAYKSLLAIERPIDVVVFVINKKFASQYIAEMRELGIGFAWMQPGLHLLKTVFSLFQRNYDDGDFKAINDTTLYTTL